MKILSVMLNFGSDKDADSESGKDLPHRSLCSLTARSHYSQIHQCLYRSGEYRLNKLNRTSSCYATFQHVLISGTDFFTPPPPHCIHISHQDLW